MGYAHHKEVAWSATWSLRRTNPQSEHGLNHFLALHTGWALHLSRWALSLIYGRVPHPYSSLLRDRLGTGLLWMGA